MAALGQALAGVSSSTGLVAEHGKLVNLGLRDQYQNEFQAKQDALEAERVGLLEALEMEKAQLEEERQSLVAAREEVSHQQAQTREEIQAQRLQVQADREKLNADREAFEQQEALSVSRQIDFDHECAKMIRQREKMHGDHEALQKKQSKLMFGILGSTFGSRLVVPHRAQMPHMHPFGQLVNRNRNRAPQQQLGDNESLLVLNPFLESSQAKARFECGCKQLGFENLDDVLAKGTFLVGFHGTRTGASGASILKNGFDTSLRRGQSNGPGEYFDTNGQTSYGYTGNGVGPLIATLILPGPHVNGGQQVGYGLAGYYGNGGAAVLVVNNPTQPVEAAGLIPSYCLPLFILPGTDPLPGA